MFDVSYKKYNYIPIDYIVYVISNNWECYKELECLCSIKNNLIS